MEENNNIDRQRSVARWHRFLKAYQNEQKALGKTTQISNFITECSNAYKKIDPNQDLEPYFEAWNVSKFVTFDKSDSESE